MWLVCCVLQLWTLPFTLQRCYVSEACAPWALWDLLLTTGKDLETRPAGAADWSAAGVGGGLWVLRQVTWAQMEKSSTSECSLPLGECLCHIMWNEIDFRSCELYMRLCICKRKKEKEALWGLSLNLIWWQEKSTLLHSSFTNVFILNGRNNEQGNYMCPWCCQVKCWTTGGTLVIVKCPSDIEACVCVCRSVFSWHTVKSF